MNHIFGYFLHLERGLFVTRLRILSEELTHRLVLSLVSRLDDRLLCIRRHLCLGPHAIINIIGISGSLHFGRKVGGQIFMSQIVILGNTSAHPNSLIAIATQHATCLIICTIPYVQLSLGRAALLGLISLARCRGF